MLRLHELIKVKQFERYFTQNVKNRSRIILRLWADHCEYIVAQRFRRGQQMLCLYRRLWDERAFRGIIQQFRKQVNLSKYELCLANALSSAHAISIYVTFSGRYYSAVTVLRLCKHN